MPHPTLFAGERRSGQALDGVGAAEYSTVVAGEPQCAMSAPNATLTDELFREEVRAARAMSPEERLLSATRLSDFACRVAAEGIRQQFPEADEEEVRAILEERVALLRRLEGRTHD